jgi:hypothetical protein
MRRQHLGAGGPPSSPHIVVEGMATCASASAGRDGGSRSTTWYQGTFVRRFFNCLWSASKHKIAPIFLHWACQIAGALYI